LIQAARPEDVSDVMIKLAEMAKAGDVVAAKVYLEYAVGKPTRMVELSVTGSTSSAVDSAAVRQQAEIELHEWQLKQRARLEQMLKIGSTSTQTEAEAPPSS
jgi:hypothetical protein